MKQIACITLVACLLVFSARGQSNTSDSTVERVELSGISEDRLTPGLREDLHRLEGQKYESQAAEQLAARIQSELPDHVAAPKTLDGTQAGKVRLVFVVGEISGDDSLSSNINQRYPVASVEIEGVARAIVSDLLYDEMQRMVGQRLDHEQAEKLRERLESELGRRYSVARKVRKSPTPRQLMVIYEVTKNPWLPFRVPRSFASYHSKQGLSFALNAGFHPKGQKAQSISFGAANDGDLLIERFAGFRAGYENVRLGTDRLGLKFDYATYHTQWNIHTLNASKASPQISGVYRRRRGFDASVAFAFDPSLYATAGVSTNELEMQYPRIHFESSRAATASLRFHRTFGSGDRSQALLAGYEVHAGTRNLDSDFVYTRHEWDASYLFKHDKHALILSFLAGESSGGVPLYERFSLGNSETLRGWNKFELDPLGGNRVAHGSLEYRFDDLLVFYDIGSVWDRGTAAKIKPSVGLGFGSTIKGQFNYVNQKEGTFFNSAGDFAVIFAVPLVEGRLQPTVMVTVRFHM